MEGVHSADPLYCTRNLFQKKILRHKQKHKSLAEPIKADDPYFGRHSLTSQRPVVKAPISHGSCRKVQ
ncbi:hypothetical protein SK128_028658, partial [Halocaridina rubra]